MLDRSIPFLVGSRRQERHSVMNTDIITDADGLEAEYNLDGLRTDNLVISVQDDDEGDIAGTGDPV